ncbi:hypothetical protein [Pseudomonas sp. dw_358]|uniref:hypothetical protein n=1 Tax=Pseudomonas sp. dw_358 TaxID=2720083 RepID=UPI001BD44984|nr:hypothetical protein [Pseudomonas sp. dw_358]
MKNLLVFLLPMALLAGCAIRPNAPSVQFNSSKTPAEFADCVYPKWQAIRPGTQITEHRNLVTLTAPSDVAADQILEAHKTNTGTQVSLYLRGPIGHSRLQKAAHECR